MARWFFFDDRESALCNAALVELKREPETQRELQTELARLEQIAELVRASPAVDGQGADEAAMQALFTMDALHLDLYMPTRVAVGTAYLTHKIGFLRHLERALTAAQAPAALCGCAASEVAESVYSKLAEELLLSIVTDAELPPLPRERAARIVVELWQNRLGAEIDDFAPILQSAWRAREELQPIFGTLMGTHELMALLKRASDMRLTSYLSERELDADELAAFQEFLFGLAHEELQSLRQCMLSEGLSVLTAAEIRIRLGKAAPRDANAPLAERMYLSYRRRHARAQARALLARPGPRRAAEEYMMVAVLESGA